MTPTPAHHDAEEEVPLTAASPAEPEGDSPGANSSSGGEPSTGGPEMGPRSPKAEQPKLAPPVCRICLEEDLPENLEQPCSCSGTMQHIHHACLQKWIEEKGDKVCEICKQPFRGDYEDPPTPAASPRAQHVTVWGQEYLVLADPETGTIRAHRLQGLYEEEEAEEERMHTGTAWCFTAVLLLFCLLLLRHLFSLFSMPPPGAAPIVPSPSGGNEPPAQPPSSPGPLDPAGPGSRPHGSEDVDAAFQDLSVTLLVLWLLVRMLVMVAPFYAVMRGASSLARFGLGRLRGEEEEEGQRDRREIELERRLDNLIQRMEAGAQARAREGGRDQTEPLGPSRPAAAEG